MHDIEDLFGNQEEDLVTLVDAVHDIVDESGSHLPVSKVGTQPAKERLRAHGNHTGNHSSTEVVHCVNEICVNFEKSSVDS